MADGKPESPLDLSAFDTLDPPPRPSQSLVAPPPPGEHLPVTVDARLAPQPRPERLVEVSKLSPDDLAAATRSAARLDFRNTNTLLAHCDGVLSAIAQASRWL